jgi:hypothetical protein
MSSRGYNQDLATQISHLPELLRHNEIVSQILKRAPALQMPNWYLGAGCIAQTVWNTFHGFDPTFGIQDYDLVYYDSSNLSEEAEAGYIEKANTLFADLSVTVEVKNEARVHLWYERHFGNAIKPYESVEAAINTWPVTATSVGIREESDGTMKVYAPFGLNDLLGMIVRPNKVQITKAIYEAKIERWKRIWPKLRYLPWHE